MCVGSGLLDAGKYGVLPIGDEGTPEAETREKIRKLVGGGTAIELFAREEIDGWDCWGNEV